MRTENRQKTRQGFRRLTGILSLLAFPVTMNFLSPFVSQMGAWSGIVAGSIMVFAGLFITALVMGRAFCGWICPAGALQDLLRPVVDRPVLNGRWFKFVVWGLWFAALASGLALNRPLRSDFFFLTESGVSVSEPAQFIICGAVIAVFIVVNLAFGRRGACHTICWMAPFLIGGSATGRSIKIPALGLQSIPDRCTSCGDCITACPMSLNVTKLAQSGIHGSPDCVLCGECVDTCAEKVLSYRFR